MPAGDGVSRGAGLRPAIPRPVVPWAQAPGRTGIRPKAAVTCTCAWRSAPKRCRRSAGKRRSGSAHALASAWPKATMPLKSSSPWPGHEVPSCGPWPSRGPGHRKPKNGGVLRHQRSQLPPSIGRGAAPVWCNPRQREEAARDARPENEAGTRRRHGRWEPTHG